MKGQAFPKIARTKAAARVDRRLEVRRQPPAGAFQVRLGGRPVAWTQHEPAAVLVKIALEQLARNPGLDGDVVRLFDHVAPQPAR